MKSASVGFVFGVILASAVWWFGTGSAKERESPDVDSFYWSARGTDPKYWSSKEGNKDLKSADVEDCHRLVAYRVSKEYLIWEDRLIVFRDCMKKKGYEFAFDAASAAKKRH